MTRPPEINVSSPKQITIRHKLARILWAMVRHRRPYNTNRLGNPELVRAKKERFLRRQAERLGFVLPPVQGEVS